MKEKEISSVSVTLSRITLILSIVFIAVAIYMWVTFDKYGNGGMAVVPFAISLIWLFDAWHYNRQKNTKKYRDNGEPDDGRKVRKGLANGLCTIIICTLVYSGIAFTFYSMADYVSKVPKIIPKPAFDVYVGEELKVSDLADITAKDILKVKSEFAGFLDKDEKVDAYISDDNQSLFTGNVPGKVTVYIYAYGYESRSELVEVTIKEKE